jgi:hypothetical protein
MDLKVLWRSVGAIFARTVRTVIDMQKIEEDGPENAMAFGGCYSGILQYVGIDVRSFVQIRQLNAL